MMRLFTLLFVITFTYSCSVKKSTSNSNGMMTMTMDLSSVNLSETYRVIPATFETVTTPITLVDKVMMDGFYTEEKLEWLVKSPYKSLLPTDEIEAIIYKSDTLISYPKYKEVISEKMIKEYSTFWYCAKCDETNGIHLTEVRKKIGAFSNTVGKPHQKMVSKQKLYDDAKIKAIYTDGKKTITVTGTKSELTQILNHPKLAGIKYSMKKI